MVLLHAETQTLAFLRTRIPDNYSATRNHSSLGIKMWLFFFINITNYHCEMKATYY